MILSDDKYFVGEIYLPDITTQGLRSVSDNVRLNNFKKKYEFEFMDYAFGAQLRRDIYTNLDASGSLLVGADPKWDRLLNGHIYIRDGVNYYWRGLVDDIEGFPESIIAYYVYYWYIKKGIRQTTSVGIVKTGAENAKNMGVSVIPETVSAWRIMHKWYGSSSDLNNFSKHYSIKGVHFIDHFNGRDNTKNVSLYRFMSDNTDDYDNWNFTQLENKNEFGI